MGYKKSARTGIVINDDSFSEYLQKRETVKETMRAKQQVRETKNELASVKTELAEMKQLLYKLLEKKE